MSSNTKVPQFVIDFVRSLPRSQQRAYALRIKWDWQDAGEMPSIAAWRQAVDCAQMAWRSGVRL